MIALRSTIFRVTHAMARRLRSRVRNRSRRPLGSRAPRFTCAVRGSAAAAGVGLLSVLAPAFAAAAQFEPPPGAPADALAVTLRAERRRIEMIRKVAPAVVCIFDKTRRGGGSGVLVDRAGFGVTNYHVVAGLMDDRRGLGGLSDGRLYDLRVLGIDPGGDLAMFKLEGAASFPSAELGDSNTVHVGDPVVAMGNPFLLSEDSTPTVTCGIVTGIHRYQKGQGRQLLYSDCIQTDTPINPGNSGGPLFDRGGKIIGINGRISINDRQRLNVGVGYAISANQIRRFLPGLRAGLLVRHGSLGATVDDIAGRGALFNRVLEDSPAWRVGIRPGDRLLRFASETITSANHFASLLGTYPEGWPVDVEFEHDGSRHDVLCRLEPISPGLRAPFELDRAVNDEAVNRVLERFTRAVQNGQITDDRSAWRYQVTRRELDAAPGALRGRQPSSADPANQTVFEGEFQPGRPAKLYRLNTRGRRAETLVYDATGTGRSARPGGDAKPVPPIDALLPAALYIMQTQLFTPFPDLDRSETRHVGGDALARGAFAGDALPSGTLPPAPSIGNADAAAPDTAPGDVSDDAPDAASDDAPHATGPERTGGLPILEVLEQPLAGHAVTRFEYDAETFLLRRIIVTDTPTRRQVVIDVGDYEPAGRMHLPTRITVRDGARVFIDRWSGWERIEP